MKRFKFKRILTLIAVFALSITSSGLIAANEQEDRKLYFYNNDVSSVLTIDQGVRKKQIRIDTTTLQEGVEVLGYLQDEDPQLNQATNYVYEANGTYKIHVVYLKTVATKDSDTDSGAVEMELLLEFDINDIKEMTTTNKDPLTSTTLSTKNTGKSVAISLSENNESLKQPGDYVPNNAKQFKFVTEIAVTPVPGFLTNRIVEVKIPRYFAIEKGVLESLSGTTFDVVSVDYAGYYDVNTQTFTWEDDYQDTTVRIKLHDSASDQDENNIPRAIGFTVYQDFNAISKNEQMPAAIYTFSIVSNMSNQAQDPSQEDSFSLEVPFKTNGLRLKPVSGSNMTASQVNNVTNFEIKHSKLFYDRKDISNYSGYAYPKKLNSIPFKFEIEKDPSSLQMESFTTQIPLPKGYILDPSANYNLTSRKGGLDGKDLYLNQDSSEDWFKVVNGNKIQITLDESYAQGLLQDTNTIGSEAASINFRLLRVHDDGTPFNRGVNEVIPFNTEGETLKSIDSIQYETVYHGKPYSEKGDDFSIQYTPNTAKYQIIGDNRTFIKTSSGNGINYYLRSEINDDNTLIKDVEVSYSFEGVEDLKAPIKMVSLFKTDQFIDPNVKIKLTYKTTDNTIVQQNYDDFITSDKGIKLKPLYLDTLPNFKTLMSVSFTYPYVVGYSTSPRFAPMDLTFDTDRRNGSDNTKEEFYIKTNTKINGVDSLDPKLSRKNTITLNPNTRAITVTTDNKKSTKSEGNAPISKKINNSFLSGRIAVSNHYPSLADVKIEIGNDDKLNNPLQFITNGIISGSEGTYTYTLAGSEKVHTENYQDGIAFNIPNVDIDAGRFVSSFNIHPKGFDDNENGKDIKWQLFFEDNIVPSQYYQYKNGNYESVKISNRMDYSLTTTVYSESTILKSGSGSSLTFDTLKESLHFYDSANLSGDTIFVERATDLSLFKMGVKNNYGINGIDYDMVELGIDTSQSNESLEAILSLVTGFELKTNMVDKPAGQYIEFEYEVLNLDTNVKHSVTKVITIDDLTKGTHKDYFYDFGLQSNEVLVSFKQTTNMFETTTNDGYIDLSFKGNQVINKVTKNGHEIIGNSVYEVPTYIKGKVHGGGSKTDRLDQKSYSPRFKYLIDSDEFFNRSIFNMSILKSDYQSNDANPKFAYIAEDRPFTKPVMTTNIYIDQTVEGLYDARFEVVNKDAAKIFSIIGGVNIKSDADLILKGRIDYLVYNTKTMAQEMRSIDLLGNQVSQNIVFNLTDDEVIQNITIYADNLFGAKKKQNFNISYMMRDGMGKTQFWTPEKGYEAIQSGYAMGNGEDGILDAYIKLTHKSGYQTRTVHSGQGSSISFYKLHDRFVLAPDTGVLGKTIYQGQKLPNNGESIAGFTFTRFKETKTFENVTFSFITEGVNKQIMALTEGIRMYSSPSNGVIKVQTAKGPFEYPLIKGSNLVDFNLDDDNYVTDISIHYDEINSNQVSISGEVMKVEFMLNESLGGKTRDGNIISPEQSFDFMVRFTADNYDMNSGMEKPPVSGLPSEDLGINHANKRLGSATFGTFEIAKVPDDFMLNYISKTQTVGDIGIGGGREVYQRSNITFTHEPTIAWGNLKSNLIPDQVVLDNPRLYYVLDNRFDYQNASFEFVDNDGNVVPTSIKIERIPGQSYSVLEVSFTNDFSLKMGDLNGIYSDFITLGSLQFDLKTSHNVTGTDIKAVKGSYLYLGNSIASDPDKYNYSHDVNKYMTPSFDLGSAGNQRQYLNLGEGKNFTILKNAEGGAQNTATTKNQSGLQVSGTSVTEFGQDIVVSSGAEVYEETILYVPIPKKNLTYDIKDGSGGRQLNSDFDMILTGPITHKSNNQLIRYQVEYTSNDYVEQNGLLGKIEDDVSYEVYDKDNKDSYTMARIVIEKMPKENSITFSVPMIYGGDKTTSGLEVAFSNVAYTYRSENGTQFRNPRYAFDLEYRVNEAMITGTVWHDRDNSQTLNNNNIDKLLAGIKVSATDTKGNVYTTTTNDLGVYTFLLHGGQFTLQFEDKSKEPFPETMDFVKANVGPSDLSSKVDASGKVVINLDTSDVRFINAGYKSNLDNMPALIDDIVMWEGDTEFITLNNPLGLQVNIPTQTLVQDGFTVATTRTNPYRVEGARAGVVHAKYSYPDGKGGVVNQTFKITVLKRYTVSYEVQLDAGIANGILIPKVGYVPPVELTTLQEYVYDQKDPEGNYVTQIPTPSGISSADADYIFDGWVLADGSEVDLNHYQIAESTTFYARFAADTNKDGVADKYQVRFEYVTIDANGNGNLNDTPFVEWVTRYIDPTLPIDEIDDLSNLSTTQAVYPITVQSTPQSTEAYTFVGWQDQNDVVYQDGDEIVGTLFAEDNNVFSAVYERNQYLVEFEVAGENGEIIPHDYSESVLHGDKVSTLPKTKDSNKLGVAYVFDGWFLADGNVFDIDSYEVFQNTTVYAHFAQDTNHDGIADKYQVRFEYITLDGLGNGNVGQDSYVEWVTRYIDPSLTGDALNDLTNLSQTALVSPQSVQIDPIHLDNYDFTGWVSDTDPIRNYVDGKVIVEDRFIENEVVFTATYKLNDVKDNGNEGKLPGTGVDTSNQILFSMILLLLGSTALLLALRKKSENSKTHD